MIVRFQKPAHMRCTSSLAILHCFPVDGVSSIQDPAGGARLDHMLDQISDRMKVSG